MKAICTSRRVLAAVVILAASTFISAAGEAAQGKRPRREATVLYKVKPGASSAEKKALAKVEGRHGLAAHRKLVNGQVTQGKAAGMQVASEEEIAAELRATGAVEFAEPDYLVPFSQVPNDPSFGSQWWQAKIQSAAGWDITTGSASIKVAVCDSGVDTDHPDLAANIAGPGFNVADYPVTNSGEDFRGHGTKVAGCIGAVGNNGIGIAGVNWNVKILPIRITNLDSGAYFSDMAEGIRLAADQGCKVANLSFGSSGALSSTVESAAAYMRSKGGLLVASAGNDNNDGDNATIYPDNPSFIIVGATTSSDTRASWSNYGSYIDVVAPGASILTTEMGGTYVSSSGTSFSSPITAGLAALIWSINPGFTPAQVEGFIFDGADDLGDAGDDRIFGHGRINVANSLNLASAFVGNLVPLIDSAPWANPNSITLGNTTTVNVIASDPDSGPSALTYTWSKVSGPGTVGFSPNGSTSAASSTASFSAAGTYVVRVTVSDGTDSVSGDTDVVVTDPSVINPPSNLTGTVSGSTVTLRWTDNSSNETGFQIDRGVKVRKTTTWTTNVATVGANATSFSQTVSNGTYLYRVRAFNSSTGKVSANSNEVQVKVGTTGGGGKGKNR